MRQKWVRMLKRHNLIKHGINSLFVLHVSSNYISLQNSSQYIGKATGENIASGVHSVKYISFTEKNTTKKKKPKNTKQYFIYYNIHAAFDRIHLNYKH